jgi:hypothetical protein
VILGSHNSLETIASFSSGSERRWRMLEVKCGITGVLPLLVVTIFLNPHTTIYAIFTCIVLNMQRENKLEHLQKKKKLKASI